MAAAPVQHDRESVRSSEGGAVAQADDPCRERADMLPEYDCWPVEPVEQAVLNHGPSPSAQLSAGWNTATSVPDQLPGSADKTAQAPSKQVTCTSCPHACITGTSMPLSVMARVTLA